MKKWFIRALVILLTASLLAGCAPGQGIAMEDLSGTWRTVMPDTREEAMRLLEYIDAYDEEIALADLDSLQYVKYVSFDVDGTYSFGCDVEGTKACVRDFYDRYFDALYEGRTTLNESYSQVFDDMTQEDFRQFLVQVYGRTDYEEMLDAFTQGACDYEILEAPFETGRFELSGKRIVCTVDGESDPEYLDAALEAGVLTLGYIDGVEVYTKD